MYLIKILQHVKGDTYRGRYLSSPKEFPLSSQSSDNKGIFTLLTDSIIQVDCEAIKMQETQLTVYRMEGSWMNFTKKSPPEMVLCATKAEKI